MELAGSVVLITGASGGIGLATARRFAPEGAKLSLVARSADRLARLAEELRAQGAEAIAAPADLRDPAQLAHAVEETRRHFGRIDILINNAGQSAAGMVADQDLDHLRQLLELNLFGAIHLMQAVIPIMRAQGGGLIMNVSSPVSRMHIPGLSAYAATKAALNAYSDTARAELAEEDIRIVSVFPRITRTDLAKNALGDPALRLRQRSAPVPVDTAEFVAEKILEAARKEPHEQYMTE